MSIKMEMLNPTGAIDVSHLHAERLGSLKGKTIGILTNDEWQAHRALPMIRDHLIDEYPDVTVLPIETFPSGNINIAAAETAELVQQAGVDAVIIGNAA